MQGEVEKFGSQPYIDSDKKEKTRLIKIMALRITW
jgi:hypothetical protein